MIGKLYHFLGSVRFAIVLVLLTALYVIAGTFIESAYSSHLLAAKMTYQHPLFLLLFAGFFINILLSALRRRPFKKKHLPFLLTHIGLLMMITGIFVKAIYGLQGSMGLAEGTGKNEVFILNTYEVLIESKENAWHYPLREGLLGGYSHRLSADQPEEPTALSLEKFFSHHEKRYLSWIKDDTLQINGIRPIPLSKEEIYLRLFSDDVIPWKVIVKESGDPDALVADWKFQKEKPEILIVKDRKENIHIATAKNRQIYLSHELPAVVVYDRGFKGYALEFIVEKEGRKKPIETLLQTKLIPKVPLKKLEDNLPLIAILAKENEDEEAVYLSYDLYGEGLKWPILHGKYLARFQPRFCSLPYHIRLREARRIDYPASGQPFSYECDLLITDLRSGETEEVALSMNHIHETKDNYRFYLANVVPSEGDRSSRVQLAVNYAPAKYQLTYPGAILVAVGILLLLFLPKKFFL